MTGSGAEVGDVVVDHPKTRFIAFTGSKEVGLRINERAAKTAEGQLWIKRVVAEMGGKDAIIVAEDADLDEAATGVVQSAFGFQGQKCSACSRAIIDARVYDPMVEKIAEHTGKIKVGAPTDTATAMSAVINEKAFKAINGYVEKGKAEGGRVVAGGGSDGEQGFFHRTNGDRRREARGHDRAGRDFRPRARSHQSQRLRSCVGNRERYAVRFDRCGVLNRRSQARPRAQRISMWGTSI
jgi:acyl-CoA reductase-like NAD-dependent aldehyde dehydrogenase